MGFTPSQGQQQTQTCMFLLHPPHDDDDDDEEEEEEEEEDLRFLQLRFVCICNKLNTHDIWQLIDR